MRHALWLGLRDIRNNILPILLFIGQFLLCVYVLFSMWFYLSYSLRLGKVLNNIAQYDIVTVSVKNDGSFSTPSRDIRDFLSEAVIGNGEAYAVIPYMPATADGITVIAALGAADHVFGLDHETATAQRPILLLGYHVNVYAVGDMVSIGQNSNSKVTIGTKLPKGSVCLSGTSIIHLDSCLVLLADYKHFVKLYPLYINDLLPNLCLINASSDRILEVFSLLRSSSVGEFRPAFLNERMQNQYDSTLFYTSFYLVLFVCQLLMIALGVVLNLQYLINRHIREYAVHRLYGAKKHHILIRLFVYILSIVILPFSIYPLWLNERYYMNLIPPGHILITTAFIFISFSSLPLWRLKRHDALFYLRR